MKKVFAGPCQHDVKVTRIRAGLWGVRVYVDGVLNQEATVTDRAEIGPCARDLLRMEVKCGNESDYAQRARYRKWEKQSNQKETV